MGVAEWPAQVAPTLGADFATKWGLDDQHVRNGAGHFTQDQTMRVRKLTPRECERLQGFPDDYTLISWEHVKTKGRRQVKYAPASSRYHALGNSMAVPVMHWLGKRIDLVDSYLRRVA